MTNREIDALVAEKVMGQPVEWVEVLDYLSRRKEPYLCESNEGQGANDEVEHYSTSISAAWELLDRFGFIVGPRFKAGAYPTDHPGIRTGWYVYKTWDAAANDTYEWEQHAFAEADTLPMAICLAALKAVGVEAQ